MKKMLIIDGNSLVNRAFYALKYLRTKSGVPTGGVHGFLSMLKTIIEKQKPDYLITVFDTREKTFRHKKYDFYKANRTGMPEELVPQIPILKSILEGFNIKILELPGYEADDVIGTISKRYSKENIFVTILSGDKDMLQLVDQNINVAYPKKGVSSMFYYDAALVEEDLEIRPDQVIDYKALVGDTSDNIPGVNKIGKKTAVNLLKDYETLDNIYHSIDNIEGSKHKYLTEGKESAYISKELATICLEAPIDVNLEDCLFEGFIDDRGISKAKEYELNSFVSGLERKEKIENRKDYDYSLEIPKLGKGEIYLYFFEYDKEKYFAIRQEKIHILDSDRFEKIKNDIEKRKGVVTFYVKEFYERNILQLKDPRDVMIEHYIVYPDRNSEDYEKLLLNKGITLERLKEIKKKKLEGDELKQTLYQYASICVSELEKLHIELTDGIKEDGLEKIYEEIELPLVTILADIHSNGFSIDLEKMKELEDFTNKSIEKLTNEIYDLAGEEFLITSPTQVSKILFDKLALPTKRKTKTGYSTDKSVLEKLIDKHPIIEKILDYRIVSKIKSTYIDGLKKVVAPDGKIHTSLRQTVAATGRLSSKEPNLQNIPIRREEGRKIRKAFIATGDNVLVSADYSQIELRLLAHMSGDKKMIESFKREDDIHSITASSVFGIDLKEVTKDQRRSAKAVNFGIIYGISGFGLSENIDIPVYEAKKYIDRYFSVYPDIKTFLDSQVDNCMEKGYVETLLGRKREIPDINSKNFQRRSFAKRMAMNTPIQGTAADIIKLAMIDVSRELKKKKLNSKMILQVHDELIFDVPTSEIETVKKLVRNCMENVMELSVPLVVNISQGKTWYEL